MRVFLLFLILLLLWVGYFLTTSSHSPIHTPLKTFAEQPTQLIQPTLTPTPSLPELTIEHIFHADKNWIQTLPQDHIRTLIATGDVIPARSVNAQTIAFKNFKWAFEKTADRIKDADITFINLETPLLSNCPVTQEGMVFCGSSRHSEGLTFAGVDVASVGNNHAGNHGELGVAETKQLLNAQGILVTGIDGHETKDIRGVRFAFLGYNDITTPQPGVSNFEELKLRSDIKRAKNDADIVVVAVHWGVEYRSQPDDRQKELAHKIIDAGADIIIGNHPHWIQPIELYKGKLITYAHGNFVFDQMWSQKTREGVVGKYYFYDDKLIDVDYWPVQIDNYGQPHFLEGEYAKQILSDLRHESITLAEELK